MRDQDIDDLCDELERIDWVKLRQRLKRLNQRDRAGTVVPDGYASRTLNTDIPASDPEALTPTERVADQRAFAGTQGVGRLERDPVHEANVHALSALGQAALAVGSLRRHVKAGEEAQRWEKPTGHQSSPCSTEDCDGEVVAKGRCNACRMWVKREKERRGLTADDVDPIVPPSVVAERSKRREKVA